MDRPTDQAEPAGRTPFLTVDREVLDENIAAMAAFARRSGVALRPHAKTHKCVEIARRQLEAGAVGLTVATVAEAEVFAEAGVEDLFIAYPLWAVGERGRRLRALAERVALRVGVDSVAGAQHIAAATDGVAVEVAVEVDSGHHRTGVAPDHAAEVATAAKRAGLTVAGVFTFPGHGYAPDVPARAADQEAEALRAAGAALEAAGLAARPRSGGSTPTVELTGRGVDEVRPGVYVFGDAQQLELGTVDAARIALWACATVVSAQPGRVVLDAGSKVLGADRPDWLSGFGRLLDRPGARVTALSEHHATVVLDPDEDPVGLGDVVRLVPNHVCAAVNLADVLHVHDAVGGVERWPVAARGANA